MRNITPISLDWKKTGLWLLVLVVLLAAAGSFFTVSAGSAAVKLRFGKIVGAYGEGLHFKLPLVEKV